MPYLLDTNILTRIANPSDANYALATTTIRSLTVNGEELSITAQNLIEFWAVATRPIASNGLGWTLAQTAREVANIQATFFFLPDSAAIFQQWQSLVVSANVEGKQVHDARLATVALVYGIPHVLTFNDTHFRRFIPFGITPVHPISI